jgi:hypothetical protein
MASRYYGVNLGQTKNDVVEGSSSGTKAVEVQIDLTKVDATSKAKMQTIEALNYIIQAITEDQSPPA